jgi:hypothetical protein
LSESRFTRPGHVAVARVLDALDTEFLTKARCYFGGGTRCVLELGEYRESRDIDFLCADRVGYRALRETVTDQSLGAIARGHMEFAREVRADQYGIRTFVKIDDVAPCLDRTSVFAEKLLANADRGLDTSVLCRDAIDLAFMIEAWGTELAAAGLARAQEAYGNDALRKLVEVVGRLLDDVALRRRCLDSLAVSETARAQRGLALLAQPSWHSVSRDAKQVVRPRSR